ncbi:hypothetical protein, partial [Bacillus pumilus]|uniref:hypothetical protein n=1 Tax=Bacillus pumilus TaxID=1408 RepID=UPI001C92F7C1
MSKLLEHNVDNWGCVVCCFWMMGAAMGRSSKIWVNIVRVVMIGRSAKCLSEMRLGKKGKCGIWMMVM